MNSFDLFSTLVASRTGYNAGEASVEDHIPIAENVSRVQPQDIVVSDYYDAAKAENILRNVCKLDNRLIVSEDGKATGKLWRSIQPKPEHHLGDNPVSDVQQARSADINAELTTTWKLTDREIVCGEVGWAMREARLSSWHSDPSIRGLQLHQIERNFPFLLRVAYELDARMKAGGFTRLLLCSRDCYLLHRLMSKLFDGYEIEYFWNGRLTRYRPSSSYREYVLSRVHDKTLIVDLYGSGNSLKFFTDAFGGTPLLVVSTYNVAPSIVSGGIRETSNPAPHPTVVDVIRQGESWQPVFSNPANINWTKPEIIEGNKAFGLVPVSKSNNERRSESWRPSIQELLSAIEHLALVPLWADHLADSTATYEMLNSGPLPHKVIL